jgi:hypothetical protein
MRWNPIETDEAIKNKHIVVTGCSYSTGSPVIRHNGVAEFLYQDGFMVSNLSQPGGSIDWLIQPLDNFLLSNQFSKIKTVIFFQTDILRDLNGDHCRAHWKQVIAKSPNKTVNEILDDLYLEYYQKLNDLAGKYDARILAVGGLTDVTADVSALENITVAVPSIVKLFYPEESDPVRVNSGSVLWGWFDNLLGHKKEQLMQLMDQQDKRNDFLKAHREWFPDGFHPGIEPYKRCYQQLLEYL